jgi:type IV pilus assembly protein PilC
MTLFTYTAKKGNETVSGEKESLDRFALFKELHAEGLEVITVKEGRKLKLSWDFSTLIQHVPTIDKIIFARNLGQMVQAGLSVSRALEVIAKQTRNAAFKKVLDEVIAAIAGGTSIGDAMDAHVKVFPSLMRSMVKAGEKSGNLASSLSIVALQMEKLHTLQRKIRGALMYPAVILSLMVVIGVLMLTYIVPTLTATFRELKITLPLSTRIIIGISDALREHGFLVFLVAVAGIAAFIAWSRSAQGKNIIDAAVLKIPVIGELIQEVNAARTARTLSSLLLAGVDVVEAVRITSEVVQNVHYRNVLDTAGEGIKRGELMSTIFSAHPKLYPVFVSEMMAVGEETGKTGDMLIGVATYYEEDVDQRTKDMSTIIEPVLMVIIGAAVGFFALSMIAPMYSLVDAV